MNATPNNDLTTIMQKAKDMIASGSFSEAEALVRPLLATGSGPIGLWKLLISSLRAQNRFTEVKNIQSRLVDVLPGDYSMRFDLAETLLMLGEFERGWKEYRYRYSLDHTVRIERRVQIQRWDGKPMPGKTLLIYDEQGFGDTFQFIRLIEKAKEISQAKIVLDVRPEILPFAQRMSGIDEILVRGQLPPDFHAHCELMSLPMAMGLKLSDLPGKVPYLTANPEYVEKWRNKLAHLPRPIVCLVWAGRPQPTPQRFFPLATLAPLALPGVSLVSLQLGAQAAEAQTPPSGMAITDLGKEITSFEDTAAILTVADLLVSADSAPVHLAGALGRPAWVMLLRSADWRWLQDREDSPWYPSLRLFRQSAYKDWAGVAERIAKEIALLRDNLKEEKCAE